MKQERLRVGDGVSIYLRFQTWWIDARVNNGIRIQQSLRTRDRSEAFKLSLEVVATGRTPDQRPRVQLQTLDDAADTYEKQLPLYCRPSSIKRTMPVIRAFVSMVGEKTPTRRIDRSQVIRFRELRSLTCSNHTLNGDVVRVGGFIRWMVAEQLIERDVTLGIRKLSTSTVARETISAETVAAVLRALEGHPWLYDWVMVLANTGLRPQEALHVRGRDLDVRQRLLQVRSWGEWRIKDAEDRTLMLNEEALGVLSRRKLSSGDDDLPLFASTGKKSPVRGYMACYHRFKQLLPEGLKQVSPYEFRHYFATGAVAAGWPVERLMMYMGHANISTTLRHYADVGAIRTGPPPILARVGALETKLAQ